MTDRRLGLLLGADSLVGARSGIGRMTLELARAMEVHPDIADFGLLIHQRFETRHRLDALEAARGPADRPVGISVKRQVMLAKSLLGTYVPGVSALTRLKRGRDLRRRLVRFRSELASVTSLPLVYHEPNMILSPFDGACVATINDLSWHHHPDLHPVERIRWIDRNLPRTLGQSSRFIALSGFTRDECVRVLGIPAEKIDVVHLAPSSAFRPMSREEGAQALRQADLQDQGYIISVSTLEPRKNFDGLLAAYLGLPEPLRNRVPLVIVGGKGWGSVLERADARRAVSAGQLRLLGYLPDSMLVALTARCALFAYVSLYEGFGLPVVEAMAAGVPVVASSTTATGETAGTGAVLVDPLDVGEIRDAMARILEDPDHRARWIAEAARRGADFSWRQTLDSMSRTWRRAAG